jgi:hypothetical protein
MEVEQVVQSQLSSLDKLYQKWRFIRRRILQSTMLEIFRQIFSLRRLIDFSKKNKLKFSVKAI